MHPLVKSVEYAVRGALPIRAEALSQVIKGKKRGKGGEEGGEEGKRTQESNCFT